MEMAAHRIAWRTCDAKKERFDVFQVPYPTDPKYREVVPSALELIFCVTEQPPVEVSCQANVKEPLSSVKKVNTGVTARDLLKPHLESGFIQKVDW